MEVVYAASTSEKVVADSILDTVGVAIRTLPEITDYAKLRDLKVFRITVQEVLITKGGQY